MPCHSTIRTQFWIELFSDLRERHLFNGSHEHKCLLRYVFLNVLQKELDEYRDLWNTHTIRPVRQSCCPSGKPEAMYHLPHRYVFSPCILFHSFTKIFLPQYSVLYVQDTCPACCYSTFCSFIKWFRNSPSLMCTLFFLDLTT